MIQYRGPVSFLILLSVILLVRSLDSGNQNQAQELETVVDEIHGYHFHTYFFQTNAENVKEATDFRQKIQDHIDAGFLGNCRLNRLNMVPVGPHPIGSYETCCNKTSISQALTWFMENHGNLSILLHPLTRYEVLDHTTRSMFLGKRIPLDVSVLADDLKNNVDLCLPITNEHSEESVQNEIKNEM